MKTRNLSTKGFNCLWAALAVACLADRLTAAENIVYQFDDAGSATFSRWWGSAIQTYEFDATSDSQNNVGSGSQKITVVFDLAAYAGENQFAAQFNPASINGVDYTNFTFDVRFDPTSPVRVEGDYGALEYGLIPSDFSQIQLGTAIIPSGTTGWTKIQARIDPATPKLESIRGMWFKIWSGGAGGLTGTSILWIDNINLYANTNVAPPPPPTIDISKANQGLKIFASQPGAQYQRQNIYSRASAGYTWVNVPQPVTYSLTLADYPDGTHSGFQSHLFLVPGSNLPDWESSPDWNEPNLIFLDIGNNANGGGYASFRYKTNLPNGNTMVYNANPANGPAGTIASIGSPTPNGTWSITFSNNTEVTLTAPNGAVTNFSLPSAAAAMFADPMHVYAGIQPNQIGNIGQSLTIKRIKITGATNNVDEDFSVPGVLTGTTWNISAGDRTGLIQVPADAVFWFSWALPDTGWTMQWAEDLDNNFWNDFTSGTSMNIGGQRKTLIRTGDLPQSFFGNYFFQMIRR
jgi:hypothetical protein